MRLYLVRQFPINLNIEMEYLIFTTDAGEPKVTGIKKGTGQAWFDDLFWLNNYSIKKFMWPDDKFDQRFRSGISPQFSLDLFDLPMLQDAKHTDLIYLSSLLNGYIVSDKFRSLLARFNLPAHVYYRVTFNQHDKKTKEIRQVNGYWYLYFEKEIGLNTVNFYQSIFDTNFHVNYLGQKIEELQVQSYDDYMRILFSTGTALTATKLVFNENFNSELDFWGCRYLSGQNYISSRLLEGIIEEKITGVKTISQEVAARSAQLSGGNWCELFFL